MSTKAHKRALTTFLSRIHWQSHFIQKLEDEPSIEYKNLNKEFDTIRQKANTKIIDDFFLGMT
jgi:deoxyribodipyrimidine photo-lyase